jgi:hypothetical protein
MTLAISFNGCLRSAHAPRDLVPSEKTAAAALAILD